MKTKLKNVLLLGSTVEKLNHVKHDILEDNRRNVVIYSAIIVGGMTIMLILSLFVDVLVSSRASYIFAIAVGVITGYTGLIPAKKHLQLTVICQYALIIALLGFGIYLGTAVEPNQASTSFAILLFVTPLLFTDLPFHINVITIISMIVYVVLAKATQSKEMYAFNMSVIMPYGLVGLILTHFTQKQKIERFVYAYQKKQLSEIDQLTGMKNRRCFEQDIERLSCMDPCEIGVCSFDVNNLKNTNDIYGHKAGDELLIAASQTLESVIGKYGSCYRTGGDEFMGLMEGIFPSPEDIINMIDRTAEAALADAEFKLTIASGVVVGENKDIRQLIIDADNQMYEHKRKQHGCACEIQKSN